ncbi:MAG: alpha/beta hydrolase [Desulfobacterium sp.]|nr:alpha/beta hydrolase [Desulfobacterium sp.]
MDMIFTHRKMICSVLFFFVLSSLSIGCTLIQLREDVKRAKTSIVLVGTVSSTLSVSEMPVVVAAYSKKDRQRTIVHYTMLHEPGPYELMVPVGIHNIVAFGDNNKNLIYEKGEPAGQILTAEKVSAPAGGVAGNLDIVLSEQRHTKIDFPVGFRIQPKAHKKFHSTSPGAIAKMDDFLFSDEYAVKGFWGGLEFFKEIGGNVYFLEAYDPAKIPILFVHGAAGSPQNWRAFFKSIDRDKYQPWIYYYPSGSPLDSMSHLLLWKMQNLQVKYKFNQLCIAAHSMGGLVVRSFLVNYGQLFPSISCFISISTPWGGEALAETGVKYSPGVVPAWRDMQPKSKFIKSIYEKKLPATVDHYLFFGHKGNRNILRPNNDKVVTLESQLDQRAQKNARMIYGYNEDHVSILSSQQALSQFNTILTDKYQKAKATDKISGNRLRVDFTFDFPKELPRPMPALYLRPADKKGGETWLYISPDDTGREYGPFPSGDYEVSLVAPAFTPEPFSRSIHIEPGAVPSATFILKPVGYLRGYVVKHGQRDILVGASPQPDTGIEIQSITLSKGDVHRTLIPLQEDDSDSEYYLSATDFSSKGTFFFFGLPGGTYDLTLIAKGYETYSGIYTVVPGQYQNTIIIELEKKNIDSS